MKKISILIPCYNEEGNVLEIYTAVKNIFENELPCYNYEILFIDNKSRDDTRKIIREICLSDKNVKAIFNINNFGQFNSPYYGLCQTTGDCSIFMSCDFQDPVELIPAMIKEWEKGAPVVCMVKTASKENKFIRFLRTVYYKMISLMSSINQIEHFTGFGLYDKKFIDILRKLNDTSPFLRGIVAEYAPDHKVIEYTQERRRAGKTHNNFFTLYDAAMLSFTNYTTCGLRLFTLVGFIISIISFFIGLLYFVLKLTHWDWFVGGTTAILIGVFFIGGIQLLFLGVHAEYVLSINKRIIGRPLVIEEERINF